MLDARITPRQNEVLEYLCRGYASAEIEKTLGMSRRTFKAHMSQMFQRLNIHNGAKRVKLVLAVLPAQEKCDIALPHFTKKELEILRLVATGDDNPLVAKKLGTTTQTVKNFLKSIYDKTGSGNRLELALWVARTDVRHSPEQETQALGASLAG